MKTLRQHIDEALKIGRDISKFSTYSLQPTTKDKLKEIIEERISKEGPNCNLNDIDVSLIKDMSFLFNKSSFIGDISKWNVSKVTNMRSMFCGSVFNGDISKWDTSIVRDMSSMFNEAKFNSDISEWNTSKVEDMSYMFHKSKFNQDINNWEISNVRTMEWMEDIGMVRKTR